MPKGRKKKKEVQLKYSLLNNGFVSAIGKRRTAQLREAIGTWTEDKNEQTADRLIRTYVDSLVAYWSKTGTGDLRDIESRPGMGVTVDLVYKKGRKPNSIRLENNPFLTEELTKLLAS
jgi:hypothetical protein